MNPSTGEVYPKSEDLEKLYKDLRREPTLQEVYAARPETKDWTQFEYGEEITIKNIVFVVTKVDDQRLNLRFKRQAP